MLILAIFWCASVRVVDELNLLFDQIRAVPALTGIRDDSLPFENPDISFSAGIVAGWALLILIKIGGVPVIKRFIRGIRNRFSWVKQNSCFANNCLMNLFRFMDEYRNWVST